MESSFGRLFGVIVSPRKTFESIAEKPTWALALVVLMLVGTVAVWFSISKIDPASLARSVAEQSNQELPPQMTPERLHTMTMVSSVVFALVFGPLIYLAAAGLFLVASRLFGSEIDFRRAFSVTLHGLVPFGVAALLGIPVALAKESVTLEEVQGGSILASNLGAFASPDLGKVSQALLSSVDLFSIWCIVLLVIGFQTVGKLSRGSATASVVTVWMLGLLAKVGMAALR
ncbi:MAG: YIP1 family protein [Holophagales bacterium]|nr:MAG: YIP1 family protein [Holophagales bacterium]